jgi:hypothetical protein
MAQSIADTVLVRIQDGRLAESWNFYLDEERARAALGAR